MRGAVLLLAVGAGFFAQPAPAAPVQALAFSPDGTVLAAAAGRDVTLRAAATGRELKKLSCGNEPGWSKTLSPSGSLYQPVVIDWQCRSNSSP